MHEPGNCFNTFLVALLTKAVLLTVFGLDCINAALVLERQGIRVPASSWWKWSQLHVGSPRSHPVQNGWPSPRNMKTIFPCRCQSLDNRDSSTKRTWTTVCT